MSTFPPDDLPGTTPMSDPGAATTAPAWTESLGLPEALALALALALTALLLLRLVRGWRSRASVPEPSTPPKGKKDDEEDQGAQDQDRAERKRADAEAETARRQRRADTVRTTAAPIVLGAVLLVLVFDGMVAFAEDSMGLAPPLSWAVIFAFEFVALWLCWERFARAQAARPDVPGLMVGQWTLLSLAMLFQYDHAVHDDLSLIGTVARVSLPAILGGVVEWALHSRRTTERTRHNERHGRVLDPSLRSKPLLYWQARQTLAAHPTWTADQAVQHVRTRHAKALALRLRALLAHSPVAPQAPEETPDPEGPFVPAGAQDKERERVHREHARQVEQARAGRRRAARQHQRAQARYARAVRRHDAEVAALRERLIQALDALGFSGTPSEAPAADMLRAVQVGVRVDAMVGLDYADTSQARSFFETLITEGDLSTSGRPALGAASISSTFEVDEVDQARPRVDEEVDRARPDSGASTRPPHASTPSSPSEVDSRVDIHSASTPASTCQVDSRVDGVGRRVDEEVDRARPDSATTPPASTPDRSTPGRAVDAQVDGVAGVDTPGATGADREGVHVDAGWTSQSAHSGPVHPGAQQVDRFEGAPSQAVSETHINGDGDNGDSDDGDGDDDGPRGGGGAPAPDQVVPGQISAGEALAGASAPSPYDVARAGLGAPRWSEDPDAMKKDQIMALLWECRGDASAVREAYKARTGGSVPSDLVRRPSANKRPGYAWIWHYQLAEYLIRYYGNAATVRATLAEAGVEADHEAVTEALQAWEQAHGHQVLQFRSQTRSGV